MVRFWLFELIMRSKLAMMLVNSYMSRRFAAVAFPMSNLSPCSPRCLAVLAWLALSAQVSAGDGALPPDETACRAAIAARLRSLQNLVVEYKLHEDNWPPPRLIAQIEAMNAADGTRRMELHKGPSDHLGSFRYLDGRWRVESHLTDESAKAAPDSETKDEIVSYYDGAYEQRRLSVAGFKVATSGKSKTPPRLMLDPLDLGLGVRMLDGLNWLTPDDLKNAAVEVVSTSEVNVRMKDAFYGREHLWRFDPQNGFALTTYAIIRDGIETVVLCKDFRVVDRVTLPYKIDVRRFAPEDGQTMPVMQASYSVTKYELNSPENTPDSFHITWPLKSGEQGGKK
jgi:hypothetical protein